MKSTLQPPLAAKNGRVLQVLGIARISTEHQDQLSLGDQKALLRAWLDRNAGMPYELKMIAGRGSGECIDREEARLASDEVKSGIYDLVVAEDLGRIFRRVYAVLFCEDCEDHRTRVIALNDNVDTGQENWRVLAGFASMRHEMYNADTSKRIRRTLRNRFKDGGIVQFVVYGYFKPAEAKTDAEIQKVSEAEAIYKEWFRRLEHGASYSEVADWLNSMGIAPGPYSRNKTWDGRMVARVTHNPILKGARVRNDKMSRRVNQTGHRRRYHQNRCATGGSSPSPDGEAWPIGPICRRDGATTYGGIVPPLPPALSV